MSTFVGPHELTGFAALRRWVRCSLLEHGGQTSTAEDWVEWQDGALLRRHVTARWCMICGRRKSA
jgi:hypothetical protein